MEKIAILTGAGMSAESGINTFRDAGGLWEGYDIMDVATLDGFNKNPRLVLDFYNERRKQLLEVSPNKGHLNLVELEKYYHVNIITQNVDDLHERAGSSNVLHLHGELLKVESTINKELVMGWSKDLFLGDLGPDKAQLRPHIVWFGEEVPNIDRAIKIIEKADIVIVIGTSMQVYPASGLIGVSKETSKKYFIDPNPSISENDFFNLIIINDTASSGTSKLLKKLLS